MIEGAHWPRLAPQTLRLMSVGPLQIISRVIRQQLPEIYRRSATIHAPASFLANVKRITC